MRDYAETWRTSEVPNQRASQGNDDDQEWRTSKAVNEKVVAERKKRMNGLENLLRAEEAACLAGRQKMSDSKCSVAKNVLSLAENLPRRMSFWPDERSPHRSTTWPVKRTLAPSLAPPAGLVEVSVPVGRCAADVELCSVILDHSNSSVLRL